MKQYENVRKKREIEIISAFWEQYKKMPIEKITVQSITNACNIHRATFYIHYPDVYAVLERIEDTVMTALDQVEVQQFENANDLASYANVLYAVYQENKEYLRYLVIENKDPIFSIRYKAKLKSIFPNVFQYKSDDPKARWIIDLTISNLLDIFLQGADYFLISPEEIILLAEGFMTKGIFDTLLNYFDIESLIDLRQERYKAMRKQL